MTSGPPTTATERVLAKHASIHPPSDTFKFTKRCLDVFGACVALLLLSPVLLGCMLWIKYIDGGPVLYRQWRVGQDGWLFRIYKFRTMSLNAEQSGVQFAAAADPRVLPGCHWMRRSHLDELPQLINILLGHMSLVGPRPERPEIFHAYANTLPSMTGRLAGQPGLTGLAQVRNGYTNDLRGMRRKLALDIRYLRKRSLVNDLKLIIQTLPKFWDRAAC